jgi:hypothetical protein
MSRTILILLIAIVAVALIVNIAFILENNAPSTNASSTNAIGQTLNSEQQMSISHSSAEGSEDSSDSETSSNPASQAQTVQIDACLVDYNLSRNTVIFYNMDELHSNNMKPVVRALSGYNFYWKNTTYDSKFNSCWGYYQATTPTFICAGTKAMLVGEVSKSALEAFAKLCY